MPRHRINRPKGEEVRIFLEIGKAKQSVKQSAVARYLGVSEKTVSLRKSDGGMESSGLRPSLQVFQGNRRGHRPNGKELSMKIVIVKVLSVINLVFLMAIVSALDTETIEASVFTTCMLLSMTAAIVLMHILEHLKRKERRRRENERQASLYLRRSSKRRKGA